MTSEVSPDSTSATPVTPAGPAPVRRGRPVMGAILGLLFGLFLTFSLLQMGAFALDSVLVVVVPLVALAGSIALAWFGVLGALRR